MGPSLARLTRLIELDFDDAVLLYNFQMPHFANPWFLFLFLALVPIRPVARTAGRGVTPRFPGTTLMRDLPVGLAKVARFGNLLLRGMALLALVLALAGLRWPDASSRIETEGIAILVLVDVSKSMDKDDFEWQGRKISRLEAVKRVVRLFIKGNERGEGSSDPVVDAFAGGRTI